MRAERHPDPDLALPLGHHVGEHTVRPDCRQQQGQTGKGGQQLGQQPWPPDRLGEHAVHLLKPHDRHRAVGIADDALDCL